MVKFEATVVKPEDNKLSITLDGSIVTLKFDATKVSYGKEKNGKQSLLLVSESGDLITDDGEIIEVVVKNKGKIVRDGVAQSNFNPYIRARKKKGNRGL